MLIKNKFARFLLFGGVFFVIVIIGVLLQVNNKQGLDDVEKQTPTVNTQIQPSTIPLKSFLAIDESGFFESKYYKNSKTINDNGDLSLNKNDNYEIIFFAKSEQFLISILSSPFVDARDNAEKEFLDNFGGDRNKVCKLNVIISTPRWVNRSEAGKEYFLSYCE